MGLYLRFLTLAFAWSFISPMGHALAKDCGPLGLEDLDRTHLKALSENPSCAINSPEDLLTRIPPKYFELHALAYQSKSLQGPYQVDYLNPRAIVYGRGPEYGPNPGQYVNHQQDNQLIFSFNGRPDQAGYNAIEFAELDRTGGSDGHQFLRYFEIVWPERGGTPSVSGFNPRKCAACHGDPAKPILSVYPNWPGFYGSKEFDEPVVDAELTHYREFLVKNSKHPRYRYLPPLFDVKQFPENEFVTQRSLINSVENLDSALGSINDVRVARLIRDTPQYDTARYAIMAALIGCQQFPSFMPESVFERLEANMRRRQKFSPADVPGNLKSALAGSDFRTIGWAVHQRTGGKVETFSLNESEKRLRQIFGENEFYFDLLTDTLKLQGPGHDNPNMAGIRLLMEGRNIEIGDWFQELLEPTYRNHNGGSPLGSWALELARHDKELAQFKNADKDDQEWPVICADLRKASMKAMSAFNVNPIVESPLVVREPYPQVFLNTCAKCHALPDAERGDLPFVPYDDPSALETFFAQNPGFKVKIWNRINDSQGAQMPPFRILNKEEIKAIEVYLNNSRH